MNLDNTICWSRTCDKKDKCARNSETMKRLGINLGYVYVMDFCPTTPEAKCTFYKPLEEKKEGQ